MSDFQKQLRDHFHARSLPAEKVEAILAKGRAVAAGAADGQPAVHPRAGRDHRWLLALAAALVILAGGAYWRSAQSGADYARLRPVVIAFFAQRPAYPLLSAEPDKLRAWVLAHGAPPALKIPAKLQALPGMGCTILEVEGRPTYLLCFMTVDESGRQDGGMVHLLVARRSDFRHLPQPGAPSIATTDGWNFASWTEGEIIYTIAAPIPAAQLRRYVSAPAKSRPVSRG